MLVEAVSCDVPAECRSATAMTPPPLLTAAAAVLLLILPMTSLPVSATDAETCFFRQHQNVNINIRLAANKATTAAEARAVRSEQACVRACCSEEVKPGGLAMMRPGVYRCRLFTTTAPHAYPYAIVCSCPLRRQVQHGCVQGQPGGGPRELLPVPLSDGAGLSSDEGSGQRQHLRHL